MPSIQIKDVPDETHAELVRRAANAHQSLQEYLRSLLIAEASRPTVDELLDRIDHRRGGRTSPDDVVAALQDDRRQLRGAGRTTGPRAGR